MKRRTLCIWLVALMLQPLLSSAPAKTEVPSFKALTTASYKPLKPLSAPKLVEVQTAAYVAPPPPVVAPAPPPPPPTPVVGCGSDPSMAYIYRVESGCNSAAYNPGGCRGLGQACPGSKLPCSDYDWTCQDNWFRNYAVEVYGSIYNAYLFRTAHNYW